MNYSLINLKNQSHLGALSQRIFNENPHCKNTHVNLALNRDEIENRSHLSIECHCGFRVIHILDDDKLFSVHTGQLIDYLVINWIKETQQIT